MRPGDVAAYCPDAGDIVWLDFLATVANEQACWRPALILSPRVFNELTNRCIACPITRRDRDWSFHVQSQMALRSSALCKLINCAASHGSSADLAL